MWSTPARTALVVWLLLGLRFSHQDIAVAPVRPVFIYQTNQLNHQDVIVYLHVLWSMGTFAFANAPFAPQLAWENRHRKKTQISWPNLECLLRRSVSGFNTLCHNFAGSLQIPAEKFERKGDQKCHRSALGRTGAHFR